MEERVWARRREEGREVERERDIEMEMHRSVNPPPGLLGDYYDPNLVEEHVPAGYAADPVFAPTPPNHNTPVSGSPATGDGDGDGDEAVPLTDAVVGEIVAGVRGMGAPVVDWWDGEYWGDDGGDEAWAIESV